MLEDSKIFFSSRRVLHRAIRRLSALVQDLQPKDLIVFRFYHTSYGRLGGEEYAMKLRAPRPHLQFQAEAGKLGLGKKGVSKGAKGGSGSSDGDRGKKGSGGKKGRKKGGGGSRGGGGSSSGSDSSGGSSNDERRKKKAAAAHRVVVPKPSEPILVDERLKLHPERLNWVLGLRVRPHWWIHPVSGEPVWRSEIPLRLDLESVLEKEIRGELHELITALKVLSMREQLLQEERQPLVDVAMAVGLDPPLRVRPISLFDMKGTDCK